MLLVDSALAAGVFVLFAQGAQSFDSLFSAHGSVKGRVSALFSDLGADAMATPLSIEHLESVASTQDEARSRFSVEPFLVTAFRQSNGRGRSGSEWLNADRSLAASVAFAPVWPQTAISRIPLIAALAVVDLVGPRLRVKWPNDLLVEGCKVGGILSEAADGVVVVGLGLNVYWTNPPPGMGAVHSSDPGSDHARDVAVRWATSLMKRVEAGWDDWGRSEFESCCDTVGSRIEWDPAGAGSAVGIDDEGGLIVETASGSITITAGEVRHIRSD
jgi:BirA family transcriptional regulator, biotin operon repressor / biotin---[acetyl-CoA-carboxylase] ligase